MRVKEPGGWKHGTGNHTEEALISTYFINITVAPAASATRSQHLFCCCTAWLKGRTVTLEPELPQVSVHLKASAPTPTLCPHSQERRAATSPDASRQECPPQPMQKSFMSPSSCHRNASHGMISTPASPPRKQKQLF